MESDDWPARLSHGRGKCRLLSESVPDRRRWKIRAEVFLDRMQRLPAFGMMSSSEFGV
jgi:hypothetical protein